MRINNVANLTVERHCFVFWSYTKWKIEGLVIRQRSEMWKTILHKMSGQSIPLFHICCQACPEKYCFSRFSFQIDYKQNQKDRFTYSLGKLLSPQVLVSFLIIFQFKRSFLLSSFKNNIIATTCLKKEMWGNNCLVLLCSSLWRQSSLSASAKIFYIRYLVCTSFLFFFFLSGELLGLLLLEDQ